LSGVAARSVNPHARALERGKLARPRARVIAAKQARAHLGSGRAHGQLCLVTRERARNVQRGARNLVATHPEARELGVDHALRRGPRAASVPLARMRPPSSAASSSSRAASSVQASLSGACRSCRARSRASCRGSPWHRLEHMAAAMRALAFGDERELEQRAVGDRPADIDARLGGEPPLRLQRAADGASAINAVGPMFRSSLSSLGPS